MKQLFFLLVVCSFSLSAQPGLYKTVSGSASFVSEAPLEIIKASSDALSGLLHVQQKNFAFTIPVKTFQGFNSALQREHFHENYMESGRFPSATFTGKIIDDFNWSQPGEYLVRAKGKLVIHGVEQERIIKVSLKVDKKGFSAKAEFNILLQEFDIAIPRIVHQKIAEEIRVYVQAQFAAS
jgi:polyisoprenoid-binding protein YceI